MYFFLSRSPCRVITTSVDAAQLEGVLWGEIRNFIQTSKFPLDAAQGGPLVINHLHLRKQDNGIICGLSYCLGRVAAKGEGMLGHHIAEDGSGIPKTLYMADEASGVDDTSYKRADTWARRKLIIGNPYPCENFFKRGVEAGDLLAPDKSRYYRKVIRITGHNSPNVRIAKENISKGGKPELVIPGVLPYDDYLKRLHTWDPIQQSVGIDARFYEGAEVQLYPKQWLDHSATLAIQLSNSKVLRIAKAIGVDPAEGGDSTSWCVVDEKGIIDLISMKTPRTEDIKWTTISLMTKYNVDPESVLFDSGGGGRQIAGELRERGYKVRTVGFGEAVAEPPHRGTDSVNKRIEQKEDRYIFKNRRAQMYYDLRRLMDPTGPNGGFAIPTGGAWLQQYDRGIYDELRHQLRPIPLDYDAEGRFKMLPKNPTNPDSKEPCLVKLIGHSPDEADALVLAIHAMLHKRSKIKLGTGR